MPTYEYRCLDCKRRFEIFMTYAEYGRQEVHCPRCRGTRVQRRIGRGRRMRRMSRELGEDIGPEFDEVVDRLEAGQSPEEIESALPELAEGEADF